MKKITTKIITLFAACAVVMFASCTNPATSGAGAGSELTVAGNGGTVNYTEIWSGEQALSWSSNFDLDHTNFSSDVCTLRVSFKDATEGACFKLTVSDPWTEGTVASADGGTLATDNAVGISGTGTVVLTFNSGIVAKIVGEGHTGAWGGVTFQGQNATLTKVEVGR